MKLSFSRLFLALGIITSTISLWHCIAAPDPLWFGVALTALPPVVNRFLPYDLVPSVHHKVKLPTVSLLVLSGLALVLLTLPERGPALWFALACTGGFLLDTYWARAEPTK